MLNILLSWERLRALNEAVCSASVQANSGVADPAVCVRLAKAIDTFPSTSLKTVKNEPYYISEWQFLYIVLLLYTIPGCPHRQMETYLFYFCKGKSALPNNGPLDVNCASMCTKSMRSLRKQNKICESVGCLPFAK